MGESIDFLPGVAVSAPLVLGLPACRIDSLDIAKAGEASDRTTLALDARSFPELPTQATSERKT